MYAIPADDRPRMIEWEAGTDVDDVPADIQWWQPANVDYGGRVNASVVIDSKGEMAVFNGSSTTIAGMAPAPYAARGPVDPPFWPLGDALDQLDLVPAAMSHLIRRTGYMVASVNDVLGLTAHDGAGRWETQRWKLGDACTSLKVYPPLRLGLEGTPEEFAAGVECLGERVARRVKRAFLDRLAEERRAMRSLSDRVEAHWR